ncbi:MAG: Jag N-terminal domain-containing protein [Ardenticatenaceae bacterium]|nr:Jag N-terminal domain-containing protein [Ardenticatenaceae bacterium]
MQKALDRLGKDRDEVEIRVLRESSGGLLGFGAHDAIVRVTELVPVAPPEPIPAPAARAAPAPTAPLPPAHDEDDEAYTPGMAGSEQLMELSREVLLEILGRMNIIADVQAQWAAPAGPDEERALILDIVGDDLGVLIGRRGETLRDLQYIVRLIVGRKIGGWANIVVDVEGYKQRRETSLRKLARQMAERAVMSRRPIFMEPMAAYERRIIHLELREHPSVTTQSSGEGERRKVGIYPK